MRRLIILLAAAGVVSLLMLALACGPAPQQRSSGPQVLVFDPDADIGCPAGYHLCDTCTQGEYLQAATGACSTHGGVQSIVVVGPGKRKVTCQDGTKWVMLCCCPPE